MRLIDSLTSAKNIFKNVLKSHQYFSRKRHINASCSVIFLEILLLLYFFLFLLIAERFTVYLLTKLLKTIEIASLISEKNVRQ